MVVENVVQIGNPLLKGKSKKIKDLKSEKTKKTIENLIDSMRHYNLVGMAAPQIGEKLRIFVTEIRQTPVRTPEILDKLRVFINPKITWYSKEQVIVYEGCGSVAHGDLFGPVRRPEKVKVIALDENGKSFSLKVSELLARVIQHEYDHLDGIEFTEKITDIKKIMSKEEYLKMVCKSKK